MDPAHSRRFLSSKSARLGVLVLAGSLGICSAFIACQHVGKTDYVARGLPVPATGDRHLDELFVRLRVVQLSLNESERFYLDVLTALSVRLDSLQLAERGVFGDASVPADGSIITRFGTSAEPDIAGIAAFIHTRSDALRATGRVLQVELDTTAAEQILANPLDDRGTCGVVTSGRGVSECLAQLRAVVLVRVTETAAQTQAEVDEAEGSSTEEQEPESENSGTSAVTAVTISTPLVDAASDALASLLALRLRMVATGSRALALRDAFAAIPTASRAHYTTSTNTQIDAAMSFLQDATTRADLQARVVGATADSLADGLHRGSRALAPTAPIVH